jgi:aerobic-type carbon monoxide dehydrogenase small subunit (CoxS/CutS family)
LKGRRVVTIEALGSADVPHPLQRAWVAHQVRNAAIARAAS